MKYDDGIERSAELLRMALPLMSRQAAALHPISYAVWYEYVGEQNPPLRSAIDDLLRRHGKLDEAGTQALFRKHVADVDPAAAERVADGFQRVLSGMSDSAARAGDQTMRFGSSLTRLNERLGSDLHPQLAEVLGDTRDMLRAIEGLQTRLAESQREIAELREEVHRARHESLVDALTGLANRRAFDQRLAACIAGSMAGADGAGRPCLVVTDIDHFKRINDKYGHGFGDQVLKAVAQVLRSFTPASGVAARIGGEEFALLLPDMAVDAAQAIAEQVRTTIGSSRVRRGPDELIEHVTVSLGVVPCRKRESPREFLDRADAALYASKQAGRDRVTVVRD